MTEEQKANLIRIAALTLFRYENPGGPAGAVNKASEWWKKAEAILDAIEPHLSK